MCGFENFSRRLTNENESLRGWPNMICAGERLQFGSGLLHSCNMACKKLSWSRLPVGPVLDSRRRLAVFHSIEGT